ncbi:MAG: peptide deformylase [Gemmobacter sp.]
MTARPCLRWPHPLLRTPAAPVGSVTDEVRRIWDDMVDTMEAMPGYGLAAPQIGVSLRLAVVDCSAERGFAVRMADPVLLWASAETFRHVEGSPNLPGVHADLERPREVRIAFLNDRGAREERAFRDLWATSVQHQLDHLEGRMFFDRLGPVKRRMLIARAGKQARR